MAMNSPTNLERCKVVQQFVQAEFADNERNVGGCVGDRFRDRCNSGKSIMGSIQWNGTIVTLGLLATMVFQKIVTN